MNDLTRLPAREVLKLLIRREVSPLDLIDVALQRIEETDGSINALPTLCIERARDHAKRLITKKIDDAPRRYLYGLPIAVKDLTNVAGVRTTMGSPIYAENIPARSSYSVEMLEAKGAIVLAKSNTPEFGAGANTFNEVFGKTLNPWDTRTTCGGSSGGSAAALAAGQVWLATGSDLGGSLRIPASYCSVVGLRPSPGRVPQGPKDFPFWTLGVEGPMGRTVGDAALMLDAESGFHPEDPISYPPPMEPYVDSVDHPTPPGRVAFSPDLGIAPLDPEVKSICTRAAGLFETMGATVEEATIDLHDAEDIFQTLRAAQFAASMAPLLRDHREQLKPEIVWNIEKGLSLTPEQVSMAERARGALIRRTTEFFSQHDLLLCPTVVVPPFDVDVRYVTVVDDVILESYVGWLILTFALTLTACPSISVPCGFTQGGLPVGLQILAPPRGEAQLISAAALFEEAANLAERVPLDPRVR